MSQSLPERPHPDHLRAQAKELLRKARSGDPEASRQIGEPLALHGAQIAIARSYDFPSWPKLIEHVEAIRAKLGIDDAVVERFLAAATEGKTETVRRLLELYPGLPGHNIECALACGNVAYLTSESRISHLESRKFDISTGDGKQAVTALEVVAYSCVHQVRPEAYEGQFECVRMLLDNGADPNAHFIWGGDAKIPVLYGASSVSGHAGITRLLLERGANPNDGESVYHSAQLDREEILEILVAHGADIGSLDKTYQNTPLYFLAGHRPTDPNAAAAAKGMLWLLEHGADPNIITPRTGEAPLHTLALKGWGEDLIVSFLEHSADPNLPGPNERTPYLFAKIVGNVAAAEAMERFGAIDTLSVEERAAATLAAAGKAALPERSPHLDFLFVKLAEIGNLAGVRSFLDAGMPIEASGEMGTTALHWAAFCGWADLVDFLIERGAPLEIEDREFHATPFGWGLHAICNHRTPGGDYIRLLRRFLQAGAPRELLLDVLQNENAPDDLVQVFEQT